MAATETELMRYVEALAEPDWLLSWRRAAAAQEARMELPRWDRTDISGLDPDSFRPARDGAVEVQLPAGAADQGVVAGSLAEMARARPEWVAAHLGRTLPAETGKFEARNAAAHHGCFIYVPDGVTLAEPVQITYRLGTAARVQFHPRTVLALGRTAELDVFQRVDGGPGDGVASALVTSVVEAQVADGARLRFLELQNWAAGVHTFASRRCELGRDARVQWLLGELGSGLLRSGTTSVLRGAGSEALSQLVFFATGRQHMDLLATLEHHGARTNGLMLARGVLAGQARAIYRGTSDIRHGAKDSNSQQKENSLHLTPGVRSDAIPALYIDENQLQAGHAATTGKVDEEQLFYMESRGLPRAEAERLIVHGFFAPLVERIPLEQVREELAALVDRKLRRGPAA